MSMDRILFKGLIEYLINFCNVAKTTSLDITSQTDLNNLDNFFVIVDLGSYLSLSKIEEIKNTSITYPLLPTCFLLGLEFSPKLTEQILEFYEKSKSLIEAVKRNPYDLLEIEGVNFQRVDKIALEYFDFSPSSEIRMEALILYSLKTLCFKEGHLFLSLEHFLNSRFEVEIGRETIKRYLKNLIINKRIVLENKKIYPAAHYLAENGSAKIIANLLTTQKSNFFQNIDAPTFITEYELAQRANVVNGTWKKLKWGNEDFALSEDQKNAIKTFLSEDFMILTGLPGTGKTSIVKLLLDVSLSKSLNVALMAPTGIAAKRLTQLCEFSAMTIHLMLGYDGVSWKKNEKAPLNFDVLIVDEFSMVDQVLLYRLLLSLPKRPIKLVFVGDAAQLPSVAPGNVLRELILNKRIPHINLTKIFRQEECSDIILNAHLINKGNTQLINRKKDFIFYEQEEEEDILETMKKIVNHVSDKNYQVLSPTYKGTLGVKNLNIVFQDMLNPSLVERIQGHTNFLVNDRVMVIKNDYTNGIYNGEQGKIIEIKKYAKRICVLINNKIIDFPFKDIYSIITLDYSRTIHKSQSNEYDYVIIPLVKSFTIQLQRNLLYTAVTRAKKKVFIIGQEKALKQAIKNNNIIKRNTLFSGRISHYQEQNGNLIQE